MPVAYTESLGAMGRRREIYLERRRDQTEDALGEKWRQPMRKGGEEGQRGTGYWQGKGRGREETILVGWPS